MIKVGYIQSGVPKKIDEFAQKLLLPSQLADNLNELIELLSFCSALYPEFTATKHISHFFNSISRILIGNYNQSYKRLLQKNKERKWSENISNR
jgi:hypothetical protein